MVAHIRGGHGEEWLACLVRRDWCNASRAEVGLGRLRFTALMVGTAVRAAVTAVCAGSDVAGVCIVWTVRDGLTYIGIFFGMTVIAGRTALLTYSFSTWSLGV